MNGYRMNPDREYANKIMDGIYKRDGHCPCRVNQDDTTLCPCNEFLETKKCRCKLFLPIE